ncbi:MAG: hypothetical protein AB1921_09770 [Thermodesulfobacteriota bacterium]
MFSAGKREGKHTGSNSLAALIICLAIMPLAFGCTHYAKWSGADSFNPPAKELAQAREKGDKGPVVLLITGSMIVSDFYDVMKKRLEADGFTPVVFQPEDLFTGSLRDGGARIGKAVDEVLAETGQDKVLIVAECNGGVATRYYIEKLGGAPKVERFITYVSAHHGTTWAGNFNVFPSASEIRPQSGYMKEMNESKPPENGPLTFSIYICTDEIMKPYTTSMLPGAVNIEICDADFDARAIKHKHDKERNVGHLVGDSLVDLYPIHLNVFWDEPFYQLVKACLTESPEQVKEFNGLKIAVQ